MSLRRPNGFISAGYDPLEVPNAPTIGTASIASATSVSVTFTAPSNVGGSAITGYVATAQKTSDGTTISGTGSSSPVTISGLTTGDAYTVTVAAVNSFGLGVSSAASNSVTPVEQQLWSWGRNDYGQLGQGDTTNRSSPAQVGSLAEWATVSAGSQMGASIKTNGTLWTWGRNLFGSLGQNSDQNTVQRSSPVQVGALTNWQSVAVGEFFSCVAVKKDGTLWTWGENGYGQLGLNDQYVNRSSPVQVGSLTTWSQVAAGNNFCAAIRTNGTLWTWGLNTSGQLGTGNIYNRSFPVQVGGLTNWAKISAGGAHCVATKTDGTLWVWGLNSPSGALGLNDTINRSSPVQVGALTNWAMASITNGNCAATKTDGTLWTWGSNYQGQLGTNDAGGYRSSPVQVGALANWTTVSFGAQSCFAIKTDKTLWSWGNGYQGHLGQNTTANISSPTQVGALTIWLTVSNRNSMLLATRTV